MKIKVTQVHSLIGRQEKHKRIAKALGLGRIGKSRIHDDNPVVRGMINKVVYLLKVEPVTTDAKSV
jgi:large subunit ribosomal protein L30